LSLLLRCGVNAALAPLQARTPLARKLIDAAGAAVTFAGDLLQRPEQINATRFNSVVSAHRVFDTRRFMLGEFDSIRALVRQVAVLPPLVNALRGATAALH
jgi:hypothetical protein